MAPRQPSRPQPGFSKVSALLAQASRLRETGRVAEATAPILQAVRLQPDNPNLLHDLGLTYLETGRLTEAVAAFERAIMLRPQFAEAAWRLGIAQEGLGNPLKALDALRDAVKMKPSLGGARFHLALLLEELGHDRDAVGAYRKVKSAAPNTNLGRIAEARALLLDRRDEEAERVLRRAVALDSKNAAAHELLGVALSNTGRFDEATHCFEQALSGDPGKVGVYYDLVRCRRILASDAPLLARMRTATERRGLQPGPLSKLYLAIGKAMDDLGDYGEAMRAFDKADAVRRQKMKFNLAVFQKQVDRLIDTFTPEVMASAAGMGSDDATPVLVLGLPRSGTTLCEQIVSSHPDVAGGDELSFWGRRGAMMEEAGAGSFDASFFARAAADYLAFIRPLGPSAARITDKMPFNFLWAALIHLSFPKAAIIHVRRRPIATALSIHQTYFAERIDLPTGGEDLVGYCRGYERLMAHWRRVLPGDRFTEVDYETLTETPEPEARRMIAAAGLEWNAACLHPERNERTVKTASKWQARQPIYRTAVDRWRAYEPYLGPLAALVPDTALNQGGDALA